MHLSPAESAVLNAIDEQSLVESLVDLIRIPSLTGADAEAELQNRQALELTSLGFDVDHWSFDLDSLRAHPDFPGSEAPRSEGHGVAATIGGREDGAMPALVLQGHVDVVPTGDLAKWKNGDPFSGEIFDGAVHGRGACDMKAGLAANMAVARALRASGVVLEKPFAVQSVVSEEDGGLGAFGTMLRGHRGEAAVLTEPTSGRIVTANAGALTFEIRVAGRAAHGSTRLEGVSAFEAFLPIHSALRELERERNSDPHPLFAGNVLPYPLSIGRVTAGDWASSVPDLLVAEGRLGVQLEESPDAARRAFEAVVRRACGRDAWLRDHPAEVSWPGGQFASGRIDHEHELIDEVFSAVSDSTGHKPARAAAPYGSDLRLYSEIGGIPTLHYGPGDVRFAHAPREQVLISELIETTRALALLAVRRCDAHM
jgi:acetylornithine deacetylase